MNSNILKQLEEFRNTWPVEEAVQYRVTRPSADFIGEEILEMAVMALLDGENLLLVGNKATGKNILAENLAWLFGRPIYNMSFHVNTDSAALIGTDTFENNEVKLRRGPVYRCAQYGGFGILDEINMAKSDAVAVLHAALDYRRLIDVPGYERISLHPATRFIGTMNYGYAGTKELNEALVSRFMVIQVPTLSQEDLNRLMDQTAPGMDFSMLDQFSSLFLDLQEKAVNGEISSRAVDLRGLLSALRMIKQGLSPARAIEMGIVNKCFDDFERQLVDDVVLTRFPLTLTAGDVFHKLLRAATCHEKAHGVTTAAGKKYMLIDGTYVCSKWLTISDKTYRFDKNGIMLTGWLTLNGKRYYLNSKGERVTGKRTIDGHIYLFDADGVVQKKLS